ncbi:putative integral membrane protein [Xylariales sp. PMI_506]|nr:putative integral membrane protein [Xylariales sp. PMI_506]
MYWPWRTTVMLLGLAAAKRVSALSETDALASLPSCALTCLLTAISASSCSLTDVQCQCRDTTIESTATVCIEESCTVVEALVAKNATQTQCGAPIRDQRAKFNTVSLVLMSVAVIFVTVRISYRQFFTTMQLGLDDWVIIITALAGIVSTILNVGYLAPNGIGTDVWTLTPEQITKFAKYFYVNAILYFADVSLLKLSILFFYIRIFPRRTMQWLLWGTVVFNILFGAAFVLTASMQCLPVTYNWTNWRGEGGGHCVNISALAWANAAISIVLDIWMLILPISELRGLKMHWSKKLGVALMFCLGTFVTVVSIIRLSALVQFRGSSNLTWDYCDVSLWSSVEITMGIICACLPSMRVVLVKMFPTVFGTVARRTEQYYNSAQLGRKQSKSPYSSSNAMSSGRGRRVQGDSVLENTMFEPGTPFTKVSSHGSEESFPPDLANSLALKAFTFQVQPANHGAMGGSEPKSTSHGDDG